MHASSWFGQVLAFGCTVWVPGAGNNAEQFALTDQLFDAAVGELGWLCLLGISTWSPPRSLA